MLAKLNFFKTPASERLVSSRPVSTSTGISGCFQPGQAKVGPRPTPLVQTLDVSVLELRRGNKLKETDAFLLLSYLAPTPHPSSSHPSTFDILIFFSRDLSILATVRNMREGGAK